MSEKLLAVSRQLYLINLKLDHRHEVINRLLQILLLADFTFDLYDENENTDVFQQIHLTSDPLAHLISIQFRLH